MPLYEYECDVCGHRFEVIQKFSDPPVETCPKCGSHVHKLMAAPAFQFKGSGWYITDYAKKDGVPASKSEGGAASGHAKPAASTSSGASDTTAKSSESSAPKTSDSPKGSGA